MLKKDINLNSIAIENLIGLEKTFYIGSDHIELLYNLGVESTLETIAIFMMNQLSEERLKIEQNKLKRLDSLESKLEEDIYFDIMDCVDDMAKENFKLGFIVASKMYQISSKS